MKDMWAGWETVEPIGTGGFSKVYKIRKKDDDTGDYFSALKVISIPHSPEEYESYIEDGYDEASINEIFASQVKRIVDEFRLMAKFKGNSNIVSYEDHMIVPHEDQKGWDILIRMELLTSLTKFNAKNAMTEKDTIEMGIGICRALELCQRVNVIHRDIKPQNIFVSDFGDYKLGDFGIAKTMEHTTRATKTGTFSYMAPEVYKGQSYNATIDIYSLGLVMYWALNEKRLPFLPLPPQAPTASELEVSLAKRLAGEKLPPPKNGSEKLKEIVLKACAYNSADRFQTPAQLRVALEDLLYSVVHENNNVDVASIGDTERTLSVNRPAVNPVNINEENKTQAVYNPANREDLDKTLAATPVNKHKSDLPRLENQPEPSTAAVSPKALQTESKAKSKLAMGVLISALCLLGGLALIIFGFGFVDNQAKADVEIAEIQESTDFQLFDQLDYLI